MGISRRHLTALLPLLTAGAIPSAKAQKLNLPSKTYVFEDLPVKQNGPNSSRAIMNGANHSGVFVEMHFTELGPGMAPHPPHRHVHEEIVIVKEGTLTITIDDVVTKAAKGDIVYADSNEMHGWVNKTEGKTAYYVIALGKD